jgi:uncharacterized membrane protein
MKRNFIGVMLFVLPLAVTSVAWGLVMKALGRSQLVREWIQTAGSPTIPALVLGGVTFVILLSIISIPFVRWLKRKLGKPKEDEQMN